MSVSRGHRAAQPASGYTAPPRRETHDGTLVVRVVCQDGSETAAFDFATLPVGPALQEAFARAFAAKTSGHGTWRSVVTAESGFVALRSFSAYLATLPQPPTLVGQLRPAHYAGWRSLRRQQTRHVRQQEAILRGVLVLLEGLAEDTRHAVMGRLSPQAPWPLKASYTDDELGRIRRAARAQALRALRRIRAGERLLAQWRADAIDPDRDAATWRRGWLLDHLDRTLDVPRDAHGDTTRDVQRCGGIAAVYGALYPLYDDIVALAILLCSFTGYNASVLTRLPASLDRPDADRGGLRLVSVPLVKARRGPGRHHATHTMAALPAPAAAQSRGRLASAAGVLLTAREMTARARHHQARLTGRAEPLDRLWVYRHPKRRGPQAFMVGVTASQPWRWAAGQSTLAGLEVTFGRLRQTAVARTTRLHQQTARTQGQYRARDPRVIASAEATITTGLQDVVRTARQVLAVRTLSADEVTEAARDPARMAARLGLPVPTLQAILLHTHDTVLAACRDHTQPPTGPAGQPCELSFLACLGCPNAISLPTHLPVQVAIHDVLTRQQQTLPAAVWARRFATHYARLSDKLQRHSAAEIVAARAQVDDAVRARVVQLLARRLDLL